MAEALRAKIDGKSAFASGWVIIHQIFTQQGTFPPIIFAQIARPMNAFVADSFHTKKLRIADFIQAKCDLTQKNGRFAFLSSPLGSLGATYDVHLRFIGKRVVYFLLMLIELFSLGFTDKTIRANIYID